MIESDEQLQTNTYVWSQSIDQVTISFLVPESAKARDLDIVIERKYLKAGIKGQEPVFQAELCHPINHFESLWQLEKNSMSPFSSLTASPNLSIASSFAFMSSPNHSPNSSMILPEPGIMSELLTTTESDSTNSQPTSPHVLDSFPATPPHLKRTKYRILTIHLEKEDMQDWTIPISGPFSKINTVDITSSYLLGQWHETRLNDLTKALEYYLSAADRGHTQSMVKVATIYELGTEPDHRRAFEWYKRAADNQASQPGADISSGPDPLACYIIGTSYSGGVPEADIDKDYQNALYYYNKCMTLTAPQINVDFAILDTTDHVASNKLRSHPPHTKDERYFSSSAFQTGLIYLYGSNPEGQKEHSVSYVEVDPDMAIRYWKEAALLGHSQACYNIGILYANGMGIEKNVWLAGKWFGRALKLDTTGNLAVPEGVSIVGWDEVQQQEKPEKKRRKRKRAKKSNDGSDVFGAIVMLGSILAAAGTAWYFYTRWRKNN